jgi:hypothetical protein
LLAAEYAGSLKIENALRHFMQAHVLDPQDAKVLVNLGVLYQALGDLETAIGHYRNAIAKNPNLRSAMPNLATALLTRFDFEAGFAAFESRLDVPHMRVLETCIPRWKGEMLDGRRLLVTAEQGYGDMIQFARFLPPLGALAGEVTIECPLALMRLFAALPGVNRVVPTGQPLPEADFTIPFLSLPFVRGCSIAELSASIPYLDLPQGAHFDLPEERIFKVGLVWAGRPASGEVYVRRSLNRRNCSLTALVPLMSVPSVRFYSLQLGDFAGQISESGLPIVDLSDQINDFADTAAAISKMDLIISIDTATAHLAGALGAPLWVLLAPGQADYRWGLSNITPWYPHARLFRADRSGWTMIIQMMVSELRRMAKYHSRQNT